jgi:hypothetical protein
METILTSFFPIHFFQCPPNTMFIQWPLQPATAFRINRRELDSSLVSTLLVDYTSPHRTALYLPQPPPPP